MSVYLWSFLLKSRLYSCESWEAPELTSTGSCFTWTRLNWLAEVGCPFPEDHDRAVELRQQSYCWSALLPYDEIQSDFCPGLKRILRVIIIAKLCQAVKPFKW